MTEEGNSNKLNRQDPKKLVLVKSSNYFKIEAMGRPESNMPEPGTQADRARKLRLAMGYPTQKAFAAKYGFGNTQWHNYEHGYPIPYKAAQSLAKKIPGLSALWLLEGDETGLSLGMARRLGLLPPDATS
jgi:hypothetical protein